MSSGTKPSIVFFGTGPVASESLELLAQNFTIEAVVTKPRPPHHRGAMPVIDIAEKLSAPILFVASKKETTEIATQQSFASKVAVLIDFGIIVEQSVINHFPLGIINSHFSLLPQWRGADPISFAVLSGQSETGVSLMRLVPAMDEGPLLSFGVQPINPDETTPSLTKKLIHLSASLLSDVLPAYIEKPDPGISQENIPSLITDFDYPSEATYSRKLTKEDGILDFTKPAAQLEREVRAFIEWPKSRCQIAGQEVIVTESHVEEQTVDHVDKKTTFISNRQIWIATSDGYLAIDRLKPVGKKDMTSEAFIAGYGHLI